MEKPVMPRLPYGLKSFEAKAGGIALRICGALLLAFALVFLLPGAPVSAGAATISFSNHVLTIQLTSNGEIMRFGRVGANLAVNSNSGTSADAGAQSLGFAASSIANGDNYGSLDPVKDVRQIVVIGAAGTQNVYIHGGIFPALSVGPGGDIENVTFQTANSTFHSISASAPNANLDVTATELLTVNVNTQVISADFDPITLSANSMALNSPIGDANWFTPVTLRPASAAARDIDLGGSSAGALALTTAEINQIYASVLTIGRSDNPGNIRITNALSSSSTDRLELYTGGAIQDFNNLAGNDLIVSRLGMAAGTGIGVSGASSTIEIQAPNLEAQTTTGGIQIQKDAGDILIGGVSPELDGLQVITSGDLQLSTINGSITLNDADGVVMETVRGGTAGGDVVLTANGASSNISSQVDRDAVIAPHGSILLSAGQDILLGITGMYYDNDVRAAGSITLSAGRDVTVDGFSDVYSDDFGMGTGGSVGAIAGRNISIANAHGDDASLGASGSAGAGVILSTGPNGRLTISPGYPGTLFSSSGDVTVYADRVAISLSTGISAANAVTIEPASINWTVKLGSSTDAAANTLELSDAELDRVTAGVVRIGDISKTASLLIAGQITAASYPTLSLLSHGAITDNTATELSDLTAANLALQALTNIGNTGNSDLDTNVTHLAFTGGASVFVSNAGPLTVGSVDGLGQSSTTGTGVFLTATGSLTFAANTTSAGGLALLANDTAASSDDITVGAGITVQATNGATLAAGDRINLLPGSAVVSDSGTVALVPGYEDTDGLGRCEIRGRLEGTSIQVVGGSADDVVIIDYTAGAVLTSPAGFSGEAGSNSLIVSDAGSATAHAYAVSDASLLRDSIPVINSLTGVGSVTVNGGNASDIFEVGSSGAVSFHLSGGQPNLPTQPGDSVSIDTTGGTNPWLNIDSVVDGYSGSLSFGNLQPVMFTAFETVMPAPALALTNSDGVTAALQGTTTTYTIVASNNSPFSIDGVRLSNPLPGGVTGGTYTSTAAGGATGNTASGAGPIDDRLGMPSGSSVTYTLTVTIAPQAHGPLNNIASLVGVGEVRVTDSDSLPPLNYPLCLPLVLR